MGELIVGLIVGYVAAAGQGLPHEVALFFGVLLGLGAYLASCAVWPYRYKCPWCAGDLKRGDGRGSFRLKSCWLCGGNRYVRFGARLLRRG